LDLLRIVDKNSAHQHQSKVVKERRTILCRPSPGLERPVSDERIAPNQCTRIVTARMNKGSEPAKKWVIVATIAGPQSRDFKR
jgi:hypothetical protein